LYTTYKIKFYISVKTPLASKEGFKATEEKQEAKIQRIVKELGV